MASNSFDCCFGFAPRDSVPGVIAKICKYLKEHPGWSEEELEEQIKQFIGQNVVESFNGRTGVVTLTDEDVNNLKIASAYFAEFDKTIDDLNLKELYDRGVRFVFTNWNTLTSSYDLAFVLAYFRDSDSVVYYPMATGSGGGSVISVNGKTGIVELRLSDILDGSGAQVKLCTSTEFTSNNLNTWNSYYEEGYRIIGVVNSDISAIDHIYLLRQDKNNHQPIGISVGASDAYTPTNPPPYPVTSVNGKTGAVTGLYDAENQPPYPVTSVNGKTGAVTGLYGAENPPPYPVTKVLGSVGDINTFKSFTISFNDLKADGNPYIAARRTDGETDLFFLDNGLTAQYAKYPGTYYTIYDSKNTPPYPVTSFNGLTGAVVYSPVVLITGTKVDDHTEYTIPPKTIAICSNVFTGSGTLPVGNTMYTTITWDNAAYLNEGFVFIPKAPLMLDGYYSTEAYKCKMLITNRSKIEASLSHGLNMMVCNYAGVEVHVKFYDYDL